MTKDITPTQQRIGASLPEVDFAIVLTRVIAAAHNDPAELRNAIYELARAKMQREVEQRKTALDIWETQRLAGALETAIERVELLSSKQDELRALKSLDRLIQNLNNKFDGDGGPIEPQELSLGGALVLEHAPGFVARRDPDAPIRQFIEPIRRYASRLTPAYGAAALAAVWFSGALALTLYVISAKLDLSSAKIAESASLASPIAELKKPDDTSKSSYQIIERPLAPTKSELPRFPLPHSYGVYAISNGELFELDALPAKVPDQRIFMSALINKPSRTVLPDGHVEFIAFKRDLANSAPDRVSIRVVAKVMRAMGFSAGGPATVSTVENLWAIRNVSYDLKVAPLADNREMLALRSDRPDFVLSPGRYELALNNVAYDFTIAGDITEAVHCLERTEAANGTFYSECRKPAKAAAPL